MQVRPINETTLVVDFPPQISPCVSTDILRLKTAFDRQSTTGVIDSWIGYHSLAISFDPDITCLEELTKVVSMLDYSEESLLQQKHHDIAVTYDPEGSDMLALSSGLNLTPQELIELHVAPEYLVALIGFLPGFPYLLGLSEGLHFPRKSTPALNLKPGSVAIGGAQTGIYPFESPGGWYVIGHTDAPLFTEPATFLLKPGDSIKFSAL